MTKYKNERFESLKSLIPSSVENLPEAKEYVSKVYKKLERGVRKVGRGIGETAQFYRKHLVDAAGTAIAAGVTAYTGSELSKALSDFNFREFLYHGEVPRGGTVLPYYNPWNVFHDPPVIIPPESITNNPWNVAGVILPFAIPLTVLCVEGARYYRWKNSIKKGEKKPKSW